MTTPGDPAAHVHHGASTAWRAEAGRAVKDTY
jgi:hypothetical protein